MVLAKGTVSRKDIERQLAQARKRFAKARQTYDQCRAQLEAAQAKCSAAENELDSAKSDLIRFSRTVKMLDLTGGEAVRERGGGLETYMVGGKEYHAEMGDSDDCTVTPFREWKREQADAAAAADGTELTADISLDDDNNAADEGGEKVTECEECGADVKMTPVCVDCGKHGRHGQEKCECGGPFMKKAVCTNKACGAMYEQEEEVEKKEAASIFDQITKSHDISLPRYQ